MSATCIYKGGWKFKNLMFAFMPITLVFPVCLILNIQRTHLLVLMQDIAKPSLKSNLLRLKMTKRQ